MVEVFPLALVSMLSCLVTSGMVADGIASSTGDIQIVQEAVVGTLLDSRWPILKYSNRQSCLSALFIPQISDAVAAFGEGITCGAPMQTMSSSVSINGEVRKTINLVMPIQGRSSTGMAQVAAEIDSTGRVRVRQLVVETSGGRSMVIQGGEGRARGASGPVIDTEQIL